VIGRAVGGAGTIFKKVTFKGEASTQDLLPRHKGYIKEEKNRNTTQNKTFNPSNLVPLTLFLTRGRKEKRVRHGEVN